MRDADRKCMLVLVAYLAGTDVLWDVIGKRRMRRRRRQ